MNNPEKLATYSTQDEEKQNTTQYVLDNAVRKQTQVNFNRHHNLDDRYEISISQITKELLHFK
jgi:hypothetical protein